MHSCLYQREGVARVGAPWWVQQGAVTEGTRVAWYVHLYLSLTDRHSFIAIPCVLLFLGS